MDTLNSLGKQDTPITNNPKDMKVRNENNNPSYEYLRKDKERYTKSIGKYPFTTR